ncbi:MAG TPA: PD-(D/E)XK nuclease family protein, partial [Prevotella sp.]|nr:PD-(D/E)XK nuclease family protein [Prevotella sp.]
GIYEKGSFTNAVAEKGCRMVVDSPSKIASVAQNTVWMGVDGDDAMAGECAFLYPSEKLQLTQERYIRAWDESMQNQYHQFMSLTPLRMTEKQLILVVCLSRAGEATLKHPLMVRLEQQVSNLDKFIRTPKIDEAKFLDVKVVDREEAAAEIKFDHASKLQWPDHLSPTSIATLTEYPLDFLMERMLNITAEGKAQMADVKTIQGNVAHAVIEALFAPRQGKTYATPKEIAERLKEYDAVYNELVEAKGAILQLAENKLTEKLLHEQLRSCLDSLLEILKDNELKVTGCERYVEMDMKLGLPKALDENGNPKASDMLGFIDMTLEDRDGHPVVFDFKWTTWAKGYQNKLEQNRSVQLELYRQMLEQTKKDEVKRVAYFLMPEARLYSKEAFKGRYCTQIESSDDSNIVEQLRQGVIYRKKQLDAGLLEMMGPYDELSYVNNTEDMGLYPLLKDDKTGGKKANSFSQYGLFLTKMQDL